MLLSGVAAGRARPGGCTRRVFDIVSAHAGTGGGGGFYPSGPPAQGILQGAVRPCRRTVPGSGHSGILFAVEPRSAGGRAVLETTPGCVWSHSEYRMEYTGPAPVPAGRLALQRVDADGAEPYRLFLENDMGEADVDNYVAASVENPERAAYLAMLDGAPVGMFHINLGEHPGRAFLYGVGISPGRRGQGLGQELMLLALAEARAMRDGVVLDVDSGNAPAYHIYQKLGFCVTFQVDYFRAPVCAG